MARRFLIASLPRSRSAWLAHWLGTSGTLVGHDMGRFATKPEDFLGYFAQGMRGTCETGMWRGLDLFRYYQPGALLVIVRRDVEEVLASLLAKGVPEAGLKDELLLQQEILDRNSRFATVINFPELDSPDCAAWLWDTTVGDASHPFDFGKWSALRATNVQIDFDAQTKYLADNRPRLEGLMKEVNSRLEALEKGKGIPPWVDISPCKFADIHGDPGFASLMEAHASEAHAWTGLDLDIELLEKIEAIGGFACWSARFNGRLVGYMSFTLGPDPYHKGKRRAEMGATYVHPSYAKHLIGQKLFDKALEGLANVDEVLLHAPPQGRGAKLETLFQQRYLAKPFQSVWQITKEGSASAAAAE